MSMTKCEKNLGGGFKYFFLFSSLVGEDFDKHIFQVGWFNHQSEKHCSRPPRRILLWNIAVVFEAGQASRVPNFLRLVKPKFSTECIWNMCA